MKAIIFAPQNSLQHRKNGLTFKVDKVLLNGLFCLNINEVLTDFTSSEILIVDFQSEMQAAYDDYNFSGTQNSIRVYNGLKEYQRIRNIDFFPEYNCPA